MTQPTDGDWTSAVLEAIERNGAAPLALVSISSVHWSDGGALDMPRIAAAAKAKGAALLVDATHDAGVRRIDVKTLDPDFLIFPTYKWVLGPYGRAFMYVAKRHQNGVPLEQTAPARKGVAAEHTVYFRDLSYADGARRYDMGERDHFITLEMAAVGMEMMAGWGNDPIVARLSMLTDRLADGPRQLRRARARPQAARAAPALPALPQGHGRRPAARSSRRRTSMPHRGSAACASARTSTTTRRTSSASSRCSSESGLVELCYVARGAERGCLRTLVALLIGALLPVAALRHARHRISQPPIKIIVPFPPAAAST